MTPRTFLLLLPLVLALSLAAQGAMLAVPLLTMHVYDGVLASRNMNTLVALGLAYAAALGLGAALKVTRASLLSSLAEAAGGALRFRAFRAAVRSALGGDRERGTAALQDSFELRRLLGGHAAGDFLDLVAVPIALWVLYLLHPLYAGIAVLGCAVLALLGILSDRVTRGMVRRASTGQARAANDLTGRLRQRDLVDGLGMLPAVLRRWRVQHARVLGDQDAAQGRAQVLQGLAGFAVQALQMAQVAAGAWLVTRHEASAGSLLAAALLGGMATAPAQRLVMTWRDWSFGLMAWRRLRSLIADAGPAAAAAPDPEAPPGLLIEGVTLRIPATEREVARDLSLRLAPGEMLLVVGPKPLPVYGDGGNVRDWLFVDDHARALAAALRHGRPGETYCIGGRAERRKIEVVHAICDALDRLRPDPAGPRRRLIEFVADRPGHDRRYAIDPAKAERELGWRAEESFETGLERTARWYLDNEWWWRPLRERRYGGERLGLGAPRAAA